MRITDIQGTAPTNYKKSMLFLGKYRWIDVVIMTLAGLWGFLWIILLMFVFVPTIISFVLLVLIIPIAAIGIVQPISNYHNLLEYLILLFKFYKKPKYFTDVITKKRKQ